MRTGGEHPGHIALSGISLDRLKATGRYNVKRTLSRPRGGVEYRPGIEREYSVGIQVVTATSPEDACWQVVDACKARHGRDTRWDLVTVECRAPGHKTFRRMGLRIRG